MEYKDYYKTLGVPRDAGEKDIKKAFRKLAQQYHPDVNKTPEAEARFKEINEAYQVLSDDQKRAAYDHYGHAGVQGAAGGYSSTPEGKIIIAAFTDSYNQLVKVVRNYRAQTVKGGLGTGGALGVQGGSTPASPR